jgi:carbon storage regulator
MLILQRKAGEALTIGDDITIEVLSVDGTRARLAISAPKELRILRSELKKATAANQDAAQEEAAPSELMQLLDVVLEDAADDPASP